MQLIYLQPHFTLYRCHFSEFFYSMLLHQTAFIHMRQTRTEKCKFFTYLHQFIPVPYKPLKPKSFRPIRTAVRTNRKGKLMYYTVYIACQLWMVSKKSSAHPAHAPFPGQLNGKDRFASLEKRCTSPSRSISPASTYK
jgi:hypothetical protein